VTDLNTFFFLNVKSILV